jgi:hypothetical protein
MVKELHNVPMAARWSERNVNVSLPHECEINGELVHNPNDDEPGYVMYVGQPRLFVPVHLRKKGFGERLVRGLTSLALSYGAVSLISHIESPQALRIRRRIFGEGNLELYDYPDTPKAKFREAVPLPITVEQAEESYERCENRWFGFLAIVDLTRVDPLNFERPVELTGPCKVKRV